MVGVTWATSPRSLLFTTIIVWPSFSPNEVYSYKCKKRAVFKRLQFNTKKWTTSSLQKCTLSMKSAWKFDWIGRPDKDNARHANTNIIATSKSFFSASWRGLDNSQCRINRIPVWPILNTFYSAMHACVLVQGWSSRRQAFWRSNQVMVPWHVYILSPEVITDGLLIIFLCSALPQRKCTTTKGGRKLREQIDGFCRWLLAFGMIFVFVTQKMYVDDEN